MFESSALAAEALSFELETGVSSRSLSAAAAKLAATSSGLGTGPLEMGTPCKQSRSEVNQ